ncbi:CehA/McbA family metallohydrolase [Longitalea luteola]|uniref:CehA/McbA family metallohydrolase n=1 Tax=Longitalea luteola TaxID=2812563 RepID=UPI001A9635A7|nr:CehA/McbA family metallohydrolase [Longitalea luteola]
MLKYHILSFIMLCLSYSLHAQHNSGAMNNALPLIPAVEPQPLLAQAFRLNEALTFLGSSLSPSAVKQLNALQHKPLTKETVKQVQRILDPYCIAMVNINPEARVKITRGPAMARLMQHGWTSFLVKVHNEAGVTAQLNAESVHAQPVLHVSTFNQRAMEKNLLTPGQVANRFLEINLYRNRPLLPHLSGLALEYAVVQLYSKDAGQREAEIGFNIGQGTQDIGFRNTISILFNILPSVKVQLNVKDEDGSPAMASFIFSDGIERIIDDSAKAINRSDIDYRFTSAQLEYWESWLPATGYTVPARLTGIYPLPSRRVAAFDEYPDFFFQPQVYRKDGEHVLLPPGKYTVHFTRGPEYIEQTKEITVPKGVDSVQLLFQLKRWVHMARLGWYSADHHVHAAGCSHYESPEEGVKPPDMWRQVLGEDLGIAAVLAWGPGWYHQKQFFTGNTDSLSTPDNVMRYDVEVSGFPSSHAGHLVLLQLKEDDYPGTQQIEDWPSWTLPVLQWARSQGAITGYAHSGNGLQPMQATTSLPNDITPKMDGIGANEYIVTVTKNLLDFYSAGDTPAPWELNMWYHTLNCGFRTRLSGETDFPCVYDERVGMARSYFKSDSALSYAGYVKAIKEGRSYVSEGNAHIIDFSVNDVEAGTRNSELNLNGSEPVTVRAKVVAKLPVQQDEYGSALAQRPIDRQPYWHIERARIGRSRKVPVELIVNGIPVDTTEIVADGQWKDIRFNYTLNGPAWVALRIYPSAHTNPVFVSVNNQHVRLKKSAEWCKRALQQCWKMKQANIRPVERNAAEEAYKSAERVYEEIIKTGQ